MGSWNSLAGSPRRRRPACATTSTSHNSDNRRVLEQLGWKLSISLEEDLAATHVWIGNELRKAERMSTARTVGIGDHRRFVGSFVGVVSKQRCIHGPFQLHVAAL